ncbi:hypothetical protein NPIL_313001 [Nephila pilipes]|uniref:Uncharacterized protein n=1 Tax=Nephila pilipes TaxID=299642 RepID=A0A8X6UTG0_NEPPI|nr:hypothetical protein NPIL_313001 [Nephila pilipes]
MHRSLMKVINGSKEMRLQFEVDKLSNKRRFRGVVNGKSRALLKFRIPELRILYLRIRHSSSQVDRWVKRKYTLVSYDT